MKKHIPMMVTWLRILLVPIILLLLENGERWAILSALGLFVLAAISDWLDGYLARIWQVTSIMGKFLDPVADKVLVTSLLILLAARSELSPYMVIILTARDALIGGIRSAAAAEGIVIAAKPIGKWKTAIQMVGLPLFLLAPVIDSPQLREASHIALWVAVGLSLISGFDYVFGYIRGNGKSDKSA